VPPTFAIAAAVTLARTSPVNAVSGVCPVLAVVLVPVVFVVVAELAPNATVAPRSAHTASAVAPIEVFLTFRVMNILPS
jgi:F0F1-type ATP synthase assembly protein I